MPDSIQLQLPPATRREFDVFNRRYEQQSKFVQPRFLPPARDLPLEDPSSSARKPVQRPIASASYAPRYSFPNVGDKFQQMFAALDAD